MGYESGSPSQEGRDEDDEEEYEEGGGGNRFLGFMFGNVDNSGDLDVDYLDEDAKEHLAALADKLGPSLTDIDLSERSPRTPADTTEQDYDEKAEDAVDYEDFDEQYEGPEIQAASEEDHLLPKKEYFSTEVSLASLKPTSVFDDENYDEELEQEQEVVDNNLEVQTTSLTGDQGEILGVVSESEKSFDDDLQHASLEAEKLAVDLEEFQEVPQSQEESLDGKGSTPLPVLCIEDGMVILRFSEIFGIHEPLKKGEKRDRRFSIPKDGYKSLDMSDIVEEDEEEFLKDAGQGYSFMKQAHSIELEGSVFDDDKPEVTTYGVLQEATSLPSEDDGQRKDSCLSAEPMKDGVIGNFSVGLQAPRCPGFYPLDQQDWEKGILWDNSPVASENSVESCEISGPDLDTSVVSEAELETGRQNPGSEPQTEPDENDHNSFLRRYPDLLEPFGSRNSSPPFSLRQYHPQLLRLESCLEVDISDHGDGGKENASEDFHQSDGLKHYNKLTSQYKDLLEGSWFDKIIWETNRPIEKPKLILDLQDEQMLFEILDSKDAKHLGLHARAMIITRSMKSRTGESFEQPGHGGQAGWRSVANDKHYSNRKSSQKIKSNSEKRTVHGVKVFHSQPALMLQTMKLKLSNKELANFHRPKALWYPHDNAVAVKEQGKLPTQGPMKLIVKSLGGKGSKIQVDPEETISSVKVKASKKLDFKLPEVVKLFYLGKELEDHGSLASQNVQPNSLLHLVRSKIHLSPRAQKMPGEKKSLRPPGAFKKKSELSVKDGHVFLMEYCEERPLLLGNAGMGARLCTYYQKSAPDDQTGSQLRNGNSSLGQVIVLDPADKSPYLGDIKPGCSQSSLETNMYRAPVFPHKVPLTDYLLVRSAKGKLSIRRIDRVNVVGQQEPLMEVISPGSKALQTYMTNRLLVYMAREFRAFEKRHLLPCIRADELPGQFPYLSEAIIRKKLKEHANLQKRPNGQWIWVKKRNFRIWSEDELREKVKPEDVCSYESMQAGIYRLKHLGISGVLPSSISSAMSRLPDEAIVLAAASHIERELQITPWSLSSNFFACVVQGKENIERMEITGVGDPSGRGLGFSYVRTVPKAPMSSAMMKKKTVTGRGGATVTGTDADLRRLSMEAAREVLLKFDVCEEEIAKLTRWHRIAMIRKLSSEQAASGIQIDPTTISKYARGQRMSFLQLQQQTREKCQEIWERQVQSLSALDRENESDSEGNSDLDSFAGDLENLLDAEECEEEVGNYESKHDKADGVKGLKMRRRPSIAQAEEENEDEAAEAAELCRLLMEDDEAERRKKKKTKVVREETGLALGLQPSFGFENTNRIKQIVSTAQPDGSYSSKEIFNKDMKEVENVIAKKGKYGKVKALTKKNDITSVGLVSKKIKISGDKVKVFKEKKSARESFVCGACGQLGHMRTNKNCPKYGEDLEAHVETADPEKAPVKIKPLDPSSQTQQKTQTKKAIPKSATKIAVVETPEAEKSSLKAKVLPVKFKCGSIDKFSDNLAVEAALSSDQPVTPNPETGKSAVKVNKIIIPNKMKPEDAETPKPSIKIRPPANTVRDQLESHKRSIVIRPPTETDREQPQKKIIIKRPKEIIDLDQVSQDGSPSFEFQKTKRIVELSNIAKHRKQERRTLAEESAKKKPREDGRWFEGQEKLVEIKKYAAAIRSEREEEERQKAKKKKKKKRPEIREEYVEDPRTRRNDKRVPERERSAKRRPVAELGKFGADYGPPTKRRKGGEVGLANILERIVETLKDRYEVSYLFLKPVSKKEAPDYYDIIKRPMDLSRIKEKVRKMEYKSREDFRHDVWQITFNAHRYNDGRNPGIPPLADQLLEICDYLLVENDEHLTEAESGIENREQ
ncbi:transcription initiation factor TFIID subunit 1 isoform X2 [Quercus robur]|uniref:transcription initiation factor TFIID subunit 1 isoform X2 n=1 Tax=Quercus robur TaxID=38942 RepID=UPI0021620E5A|nr:transcription initiation factor TFIID subunit 1 isoform X2 [Quercus robur]